MTTNLLKGTSLAEMLRSLRRRRRPATFAPPPHAEKVKTVTDYAVRFHLRTLIETGTFHGEMIEATKEVFSRILSIELDRALYEQAKAKFSRYGHVTIIHGDSGEVLQDLLSRISEPCLFWLDGHYCGGEAAKGAVDTPIMKELQHITSHLVREHVVLIDDARKFNGRHDYPKLSKLKKLIHRKRPDWSLTIEDDIIRLHKPLAATGERPGHVSD